MTHEPVSLRTILDHIPLSYGSRDLLDLSVTGVTLDSRAVKPGDLFVSIKGGSFDGHDFISQAVSNGAVAVVGERSLAGIPVPYVQLNNSREALTWISAAFHDWPGRKLTMLGVTGTDGKTTTTKLIYQILLAAGIKAGMISSVNAVIGGSVLDTGFHVTTPDAHNVQAYLAQMVDAGLTHAILETTSHAWAQYRVDACEFDVGVLTNITHEHLDQHGSYENYRAAKARLFSNLEKTLPKKRGNPRLAVINRDDQSFEYLRNIINVSMLSYGMSNSADLRAVDIVRNSRGNNFSVEGPEFRVAVSTSLVGDYNISNCLAALGATGIGLGIDPEVAARGIESLKGVDGRMERIELGQLFVAIVDFAHTPNALKVTLQSTREMIEESAKRGRVIAVVGSAGLRDRAKRRLMAQTSAELADISVFTAEDPRNESLQSILGEMAEGAASRGAREGETFWRIPDRADAIRFAVSLARENDIVLACGKGHERSMCFGAIEYPWDDRTAMRAALSDLLGIEGPTMPYLPTQDKTEADWLS